MGDTEMLEIEGCEGETLYSEVRRMIDCDAAN
jgi:hypothetical protein